MKKKDFTYTKLFLYVLLWAACFIPLFILLILFTFMTDDPTSGALITGLIYLGVFTIQVYPLTVIVCAIISIVKKNIKFIKLYPAYNIASTFAVFALLFIYALIF